MKKIILTTALALSILISFIQAYDATGVEQYSYIIAFGIDKSDSEEEPIKLSIQVAKPDSGESGGTKIQTEVLTVNCNTFNLGMAMLNIKNVNKLNLSHCTAIIISEELAMEGIEPFIDTLVNNIEIRPTCNVLICQGKAEEFLNVASSIEDISSKFYTSFIQSTETTSYVTPCILSDFYSALHEDIKEPVALYSFTKDENIESLGLSVFKDYKMVGRLSGLETICYNIITNNFDEATIEVYNPQDSVHPLSVNLSHFKDTQLSVKLENNVPKIKCTINVKAKILSGDKSYDYSSDQSLREIEAEINKFLEDNISAFLYKTSQEYNSDIIGFEGYFRKNYLTEDELNQYKWDELYSKSEFEVNSTSYIRSGFLFLKN